MAGWPTDRAFEQMGDMALKRRVRLEADGLIVTLSLQEVVIHIRPPWLETGHPRGTKFLNSKPPPPSNPAQIP